MAANKKGCGFLGMGAFALLAAAVFAAWGFVPLFTQFKQLAAHASPGGPVQIEEAGTYTLWHDYRTTHGGTTVSHPQALPAGFTFELRQTSGGKSVALSPVKVSETVSLGGRDSVALGRFELKQDGSYVLNASNPAGDVRVFSITKGSMLGSMGKFGVRFALAMLAGAVGFVLVIIGIVFMVMKPKAQPGPIPPPA